MDTVLVVAIGLFVVTHLDTFLVLVAFSLDEAYRRREVLLGHYLGFSLGLLAAVLGAGVATELLEGRTFLLGLVPLCLGLWGLKRRRPDGEDSRTGATDGPLARLTIVTTAGVGLSGENLALFIPFFVTLSIEQLTIVVGSYLLFAGVLYGVALAVATAASSNGPPRWVDRWLVPIVLITVGTYVLVTGWLAW